MMQFRDLGAQYRKLKPQIDAAVLDAMGSGCFIGGKPVNELERQLAAYAGTKHCITCGNGTDALQLALMAWDIGPGDAIIVPDFTFFSSGEAVSTVGATPVFVDVDERTFNIDPGQIEPACRSAREKGLDPRAVVSVDLFGLPADYPKMRPICDELGLLILEDGAQGFGGAIGDQRACSFGDISTTSFFPAKPLGCYGDGGAVFTNNDEWAATIRSLAIHGKGTMKYDNVRIGMNSRLDTLQAAILDIKLAAFTNFELSAVNDIAKTYTCFFSDIKSAPIILPNIPDGAYSSWAQYTIQLSNLEMRDELQLYLRSRDIPSMVYYPKPMHEQKAFDGTCIVPASCDVTVELCKRVLSLPIGPYLTAEQVSAVCSAIEGWVA